MNDEIAKKRLQKLNLLRNPNEWKFKQENSHLEIQKNERKEILDLARRLPEEDKGEAMEDTM